MLHIHACCNHIYVSNIFRCFILCLQVFHLDVTYIFNGFQTFFRRFRKYFIRLFQVFHLSFFCMLQLLYLYISKVDRVLHMGCAWEAAGGVGPLLVRSLASRRAERSFAPCAGSVQTLVPRSDVWALASPYYL